MYHKKGRSWASHLDFTLLDILSLAISIIISYSIIRPRGSNTLLDNAQYQGLLLSFLLVDLFVISMFHSMDDVLKRNNSAEVFCSIRNAALVAAIESMFLFGIKMGLYFSRLTFFCSVVLYCVLSCAVRILYKKIYKKYVAPRVSRSILVVSDGESLKILRERIVKQSFEGYRLAGLVLKDMPADAEDLPIPVVSDFAGVTDWVRKNWVDEVMLLLPPTPELTELANTFMRMGVTVHMGIEHIRGIMPNREQEIEKVGGLYVITAYWKSAGLLETMLKRLMDILGSLVGCLFTGLLILIIGPVIYKASPGPIFYTQERIGRNGKTFKMYKFRSMYLDADARKKEFMAQNRVAGGLMFKLDWDPRIIGNRELPDGTRKSGIGEFIRKTSLDEFPQFFNVLKGDMSLVGTRPPTKDEWELYEDHHRARMAMRPGITGMWQVSGRSNITDFEEIVRLDTQYIDRWSLLLDIKILIKTVLVVLKHEGSM